MLGKIFGILCVTSLIVGVVLGQADALCQAVLDGASGAVRLTLSLCGMMGLWCGVMRVLEQAGMIRRLSRPFRPILRFFFPDAASDDAALDAICANVCANLLGLGNAATPMALVAMERLRARSPLEEGATADMITLTVMNTAPLCLIPTTVLTLLHDAGAAQSYAVLPPIWISSLLCFLFALLLCRTLGTVMAHPRRKKE